MRSGWAPLILAALASVAEACGGHHKHEDRVWTAEEIADLEYKWGMEVSEPKRPFLLFPTRLSTVEPSMYLGTIGQVHASCLSCGRPRNIVPRPCREIDILRSPPL
jgi:hypothetical protein